MAVDVGVEVDEAGVDVDGPVSVVGVGEAGAMTS
jgi:hypothetical protein